MTKKNNNVMKKILYIAIALMYVACNNHSGLPNKKVDDCNNGDAYACYDIAVKYEQGDGVVKDILKAISFYDKSFDLNHTKSGFVLGSIYGDGLSVPLDDNKSIYYYTQSCTKGYMDSCFNLGNTYTQGRGVEENKQKGVSLYFKACLGGDRKACHNYLYLHKNKIKGFQLDPYVAGTWEDDIHNWTRAFLVLLPNNIEVVHSKYWLSAHWTKEFEYFFELSLNDKDRESILTELIEVKGKEAEKMMEGSFSGLPSWFLKGAKNKYRSFHLGSGSVKIFMNKESKNLFITDSQI